MTGNYGNNQVLPQTPNPPAGYPELRPEKRYISNREQYNPFAGQNIPATPEPTTFIASQELQVQPDENPGNNYYNYREEPENEPKKKVKRGFGCGSIFSAIWGFLGLIKNAIFTAFIVILFTILAITLIVIYKPPVLWNPVKTFLNGDVIVPATLSVSDQVLYDKINSLAVVNQDINLNNEEITTLVRGTTFLKENCFVASVENGLKFYINIDTPDRPLWFVVHTKVNSRNKIEVANVGFGRFNTPAEVATLLTDTVGVIFQFVEKQVTAPTYIAAFDGMVDKGKLEKDLLLQKVEFHDDYIVLLYFNNSPDNSTITY